MKRKRAVVLVLAALMAATTVFPTSAYAFGRDIPLDGDITLDGEDYMILDADDILGMPED